jgi:hypothetical protein
MSRFGKLKKIIGVYHVKESTKAIQLEASQNTGLNLSKNA